MTGPELRAALDELGMSQRAFAARFGLLEGSVSRWMVAKRAVPSWVPPALDLLRHAPKKSGRQAAHYSAEANCEKLGEAAVIRLNPKSEIP
jgi:DNA-binding transcriptional regulator YiaG